MTVDRGLLLLVLAAQVTILVRLVQRPGEEAVEASSPPVPAVAAVRPPARAVVTPFPAAPVLHRARSLHDHMDRMFAEAFEDMDRLTQWMNREDAWNRLTASPSMDMREQSGEYVVVFSLPGVQESDIAVSLDGRLLHVHAPVFDRRGGHVRVFEQTVRLPGPVAESQDAEAGLTNGILRVVVPKRRDVEETNRETGI